MVKRVVSFKVEHLGPIETGVVELRPLTVFVGAGNTGKSYMSVLVYALHRALHGFRRFLNRGFDRCAEFDWRRVSKQEYHDVRKKLDADGRAFKYSDLPARLRGALSSFFRESGLTADIVLELNRCFDTEAVTDLIRTPRTRDAIDVTLMVRERDRALWHLCMSLSENQGKASIGLGDFDLMPENLRSDNPEVAARLRSILLSGRIRITDLLRVLLDGGHPGSGEWPGTGGIHYLPAARSGIMQSQRVIASSLVARATRVSLERLPVTPTLPGVTADFMQQLILYRRRRPQSDHDALNEIAEALEREPLAGSIEETKSPGGYLEFAFRPWDTRKDVVLARAASMVSGLAPLVLFLRGVVNVGDTLIIEEPEAHLHPTAQTHVAAMLARLVRAGVRVLITTHSEWLLKEIGNLIREGALAEHTGRVMEGSSLGSALHPDEVGVWLFRRNGADHGATIQEIPFDRSEGVEPPEYDDVAEALYNRAADLQNKLELASTVTGD